MGYLKKYRYGIIKIDTSEPDYSHIPMKEYDWSYTCYRGAKELLPNDAPKPDKMCDFIHDSTESRVIGTPISRIRVTRKRRPRDAKPTSQSVFATTLAK
jgi:hypothetical protein